MVAQISVVSAAGVIATKAWDLAAEKKDFGCSLQYAGKNEAPIESECEVGAYLPIYRSGKSSHTAFIPYNFIPLGVPALIVGPQEFSREDYGGRVNCGVIADWQLTNLQRIANYKVYSRDDNAIKINVTDDFKVLIKKTLEVAHFRATVKDCESPVGTLVVYRLAILPAYLNGIEKAWCIVGIGDLDPEAPRQVVTSAGMYPEHGQARLSKKAAVIFLSPADPRHKRVKTILHNGSKWLKPANLTSERYAILNHAVSVNAVGKAMAMYLDIIDPSGAAPLEYNYCAKFYNGTAWGSEKCLVANVDHDCRGMDVGINNSNDAMSVFFEEKFASPDIYYMAAMAKKFTAGAWGTATQISDGTSDCSPLVLFVAYNNNGHALAAYKDIDDDEIYATYYNSATWSTPIQITTNGATYYAELAGLVLDDNNKGMIAFVQASATVPRLHVRTYSAGWGADTIIDAGTGKAVSNSNFITLSASDSKYLITYCQKNASDFDVFRARWYDVNLATWGANQAIFTCSYVAPNFQFLNGLPFSAQNENDKAVACLGRKDLDMLQGIYVNVKIWSFYYNGTSWAAGVDRNIHDDYSVTQPFTTSIAINANKQVTLAYSVSRASSIDVYAKDWTE